MEPIFPTPTNPKVLPVNSCPINLDFSHFPFCVDWSAAEICLEAAKIIANVCSAVVIALPWGVFITTIPLDDAALISILSTPIPALPIACKFLPLLITSLETLLADLIINPV